MTFDGVPALALRALPIIATGYSLTRAAAELGVTQPAVSRAIAVLERTLGVAVLRRGERSITLTVEGERLAMLAEREAELRAVALRDVDDLKRKRSGVVRIGSFGASASTRILPDLLRRFARSHPNIVVEVREIADDDVPIALRDGAVDMALQVDPPGDEFDTIALARDQLVALLSDNVDDHRTLTTMDAATLSRMPFVMTKGGSEPLVRQWFGRSGAEPNVRHEVAQITSILAFVRMELGASIIAELAVPDDRPGIRVVPLDPPAPRQIVLARCRPTLRSEAASAFWTAVT